MPTLGHVIELRLDHSLTSALSYATVVKVDEEYGTLCYGGVDREDSGLSSPTNSLRSLPQVQLNDDLRMRVEADDEIRAE